MEFKLIIKKLHKTLTDEDAIVFQEWYDESVLHKDYFNKVKQSYERNVVFVDLEKGWKSIEKKIKPEPVRQNKYTKYAVAAAAILLVAISSFVYTTSFDKTYITEKAVENIKPGFEKATLVLADGSEVNLEKSKGKTIVSSHNALIKNTTKGLVYQTVNDKILAKETQVKYNTLHVPVGGVYNIELSDGTKVWLNSSSSIKFPESFNGTQRVVTLEGEAYFDVTKNTKEFVVKTKAANVTVLGTEFNISSYPKDDVFTATLVEGEVRMSGLDNSVIITPNQQGYIASGKTNIEVKNVDAKMFSAWKEGKFYFNKESLKKLLVKMKRWYDVDFVFVDESIENELFTGVVLKDKSIDYLLNSICETTSLTYLIAQNEETGRYEIKISRKE